MSKLIIEKIQDKIYRFVHETAIYPNSVILSLQTYLRLQKEIFSEELDYLKAYSAISNSDVAKIFGLNIIISNDNIIKQRDGIIVCYSIF